jgi:tetratricopeptide (TPR) repeat protein
MTLQTLLRALCFAFLLVLGSCASSGGAVEVVQLHHTGEACICGTPDGDFIGCHCEDCLLNGGNPFNPDCTCLPLRPASKLQLTYASFDPAGGAGRPSVGGSLVGMDEIKLAGKSGKLRGEVIEDDGESIRFRTDDGRVASYAYAELDQRVVYLLLKGRTNKEDGASELRLANFANEIGLYAHARRHYGYAAAADPSLEGEVEKGLARLRSNAARSQMDQASAALSAGDDGEARKHLLNVVREFPGEAAAGEALAMLNTLNVEQLGPEKAALLESAGPEAWAEVEPAARLFDSAVEKNQQALSSGNRSTFRSALADCERARKELGRARRAAASELVDASERQVIELEVEIHLNVASLEVTAGNHEKALASVNAALALDPENENARQQRARIESARDSYGEGYERGRDDPGNWTYEYRPGSGIIYRNGHGIRGSYGGWSRGGGYQGVTGTFR